MAKKKIQLSESELHLIIQETVKKTLGNDIPVYPVIKSI